MEKPEGLENGRCQEKSGLNSKTRKDTSHVIIVIAHLNNL
jgi:hypothetical protein